MTITKLIFIQGLGLLALQAHYPKLKPPLCNIYDPSSHCIQVSGANAALLFVALYMVALGSGGVKAALPSHGADQFDEKDPKEAREKSSFFNWLLLALCIGAALSLTFIVWIQDHKGWDRGFVVSTIAMFFAIIVFAAGLPHYRIHVVNGSSALTEIAQVNIKHTVHFVCGKDSSDRSYFLRYAHSFLCANRCTLRPYATESFNSLRTLMSCMRLTKTRKLQSKQNFYLTLMFLGACLIHK